MNLRLNTLAEMVDSNSRIADIGTDHAYLPIKLVQMGKIDYAIASDIAAGPLQNAQDDIKQAGLAEQIETRLGAGLTTIKHSDQIDTVVIAGMGGKLMTQILADAKKAGFLFDTLVLEPNIGEMGVRAWLADNHYEIVQEKLILEAGHTYELIKAVLTDSRHPLTHEQLFFGPKILLAKNPVFYRKWTGQLEYFKKLLQNLNKAKNRDLDRIKEVEDNIELIRKEINDD